MKPNGTHIIAEFISCSENFLDDRKAMENLLERGIREAGLSFVDMRSHKFDLGGVTAIAIVGESHIALHTYPEAKRVSIDIFTCSADQRKPLALLDFLKDGLKPKAVKLADVCRGNPLELKNPEWITGFSSFGLEIGYHVKKMLFSKRSQYQQIDIIENENFGRILILDKDLQIAEKDASVYNDAMVSPLMKANSSLEKVLILGGGDGGIANELLSRGAKSITLVDIDRDVIEACKQFMPSVCGDAFRSRRVRVVAEDVYKFLDENSGFDAAIYDLTMHPEAFIKIDREAYLSGLFKKISKNLKEGGMVTLQCGADIDEETIRMVRRILSKHFSGINFFTVFIPSFCVNWVFASAKKR